MNDAQNNFKKFILQRTISGNAIEVEDLMEKAINMQNQGAYDREMMAKLMNDILAVIRPECIDEVKEKMKHFGQTHIEAPEM